MYFLAKCLQYLLSSTYLQINSVYYTYIVLIYKYSYAIYLQSNKLITLGIIFLHSSSMHSSAFIIIHFSLLNNIFMFLLVLYILVHVAGDDGIFDGILIYYKVKLNTRTIYMFGYCYIYLMSGSGCIVQQLLLII